MFGGPPPPPSKAELAAQEKAASQGLTVAYITCALLYFSPFAVEYVKRLV